MKAIIILIITMGMLSASYGQFTLTGKVTDAAGTPLYPASITLINTNSGTFTEADGTFNIEAADSASIFLISYTGFNSRQIQYTGMPVTVILSRSVTDGNEVLLQSFEQNALSRNIAASVSVLNKASLERFGNVSLVPSMNTVPGVKMDERSPGSYRISIRGNLLRSTFGVRNVKVYWNGMPFTDANGNTYINQVALNNVSRIEILKGPSGSMYGAGTGGVLLLSTMPEQQERNYIDAVITGGSYGLFSGNASYNTNSEKLISQLSYSHQQSDGYRKQSSTRRDVVHYNASYKTSDRQTLNTNLFYSDLYYQTPGALTAAELSADPRKARPAAGIFRSAEEQQAALYLKTIYTAVSNEYRFNERWSNITGVYASGTKFRNPTVRNYERKTEQGAGGRSVLTFKAKQFTAVAGGEYQYSFSNTGTYGNRQGITDTLQYQDELDSRLFNLFVQGDWKFAPGFSLSGGISYNNYHYGFLRVSDALSKKESSDFSPQYIPRLSLLARITGSLNMFATVSKGYSPPSIDEVHASDGNFNSSLRAETGINYEAGLKYSHNKLSAEIAYYIFNLESTIVSRRDASGADFYVNAGKTDQRGLELNVNYLPVSNDYKFVRRLKVWGSYTNLNAEFKEYQQGLVKFDGNRLTGTPQHVAVIGTDIRVADGLFSNLSYSYTDKIPLNDANTFFAPRYNQVFLKLGYRSSKLKKIMPEFFISYEKTFNTPYSLGNDLNAAGNRFYNPAAPEVFGAGVRVRVNN